MGFNHINAPSNPEGSNNSPKGTTPPKKDERKESKRDLDENETIKAHFVGGFPKSSNSSLLR